jgi:hypothetical protein
LALVYTTLQSSPIHWTKVGLWNGWQLYNSPFWSRINIVSISRFWLYLSTSSLTSCTQSSWILVRHTCWTLGIPKSSNASLSDVPLTLLRTLWTCLPFKWYTFCDTGLMKGLPWIVSRGNSCDLRVRICVLVADGRLTTFANSTSNQSWSVRYDSVS